MDGRATGFEEGQQALEDVVDGEVVTTAVAPAPNNTGVVTVDTHVVVAGEDGEE